MGHQLGPFGSVLQIGDHLGQVLQNTTTRRIGELAVERMEVVAFTAAYVDKQDVVGLGPESVEDSALHIKPVHPVRGRALLQGHPLLEVLCEGRILAQPVEVVEVSVLG